MVRLVLLRFSLTANEQRLCAEVIAAHNDIEHLMQFGRASMIPLGLGVRPLSGQV
jgi:hypothetical protein